MPTAPHHLQKLSFVCQPAQALLTPLCVVGTRNRLLLKIVLQGDMGHRRCPGIPSVSDTEQIRERQSQMVGAENIEYGSPTGSTHLRGGGNGIEVVLDIQYESIIAH